MSISHTRVRLFISGTSAALLSACSFVGLEPEAEVVRVLTADEAHACEVLGTSRVEVLDKVGFIARSEEKVEEELDMLARNAAAELAGNAVTAIGPIASGARKYQVLRCP